MTNRDEYRIYKYKVLVIALINGSSEINDFSNRVTGFVVENDYDINAFPMLKIRFTLNTPEYNFFIKNQDNLKLKFTVSKIAINGDKKIENPKILWQDIVMKPYEFPKREINENKNVENQALTPEHNLDLYCFELYHLRVNKLLNNAVYHEINMNKVLLRLFNQRYNTKDYSLLLEKSHNEKEYEQIFLQPNHFVKTLKYLQDNFGIYKEGMRLFFDFKKVYMISKKTNLKETGVINKVVIENFDSTSICSTQKGMKKDEDKQYILNVETELDLLSGKNISQELVGESIQIMNSSTIENECSECLDITFDGIKNDSVDKENFYWNNIDNPFKITELENDIKDIHTKVRIMLYDVDLEIFSLINKFTLVNHREEYKKYNGDYQLSHLNYAFTNLQDIKEKGNGSGLAVSITLKKIIS